MINYRLQDKNISYIKDIRVFYTSDGFFKDILLYLMYGVDGEIFPDIMNCDYYNIFLLASTFRLIKTSVSHGLDRFS